MITKKSRGKAELNTLDVLFLAVFMTIFFPFIILIAFMMEMPPINWSERQRRSKPK